MFPKSRHLIEILNIYSLRLKIGFLNILAKKHEHPFFQNAIHQKLIDINVVGFICYALYHSLTLIDDFYFYVVGQFNQFIHGKCFRYDI